MWTPAEEFRIFFLSVSEVTGEFEHETDLI